MKLDEVVSKLAELVADPVTVTFHASSDDRSRIVWVNNSFCEVFGVTIDAASELSFDDLFHLDYVDDFRARLIEMANLGEKDMSQDTLCLRQDQSSFWGSVSLTTVDKEADGRYDIMIIRDIDELKNREQAAELALIERDHLFMKVEAAQTRLVSAIEMIPDPFAIYDWKERLVIWNPSFVEHMAGADSDLLRKGMKKEDIVKIALDNGFIADAIGQEDEWLAQHMERWRSRESAASLIKIRGRDFKSVESIAPNGDRVLFRIDITEQLRQRRELESYAKQLEQANNEISHQALHDELTGLGNRRFLTAKLDELIAEREQNGGELVALHIDLDRFKEVNDTMGHAAGDHVLVEVAKVLRSHLRSDDVVARIGGDEFVVLLRSKPGVEQAEMLSDRLIREISKPLPFEDKLCRIGASIGIARTPVIDPSELLTSSDIALYKAKKGGRSRHAVFDHLDLESLRVARQTSDDILRAIEEREFVPHYQVQIDPFEGHVVALEVLARWQHPDKGLLLPDGFMTYAEEMQVLGEIDRIMFQRALEECAPAFASLDRPPQLAFNVGLQRMTDARLEKDISECEYPFPISFELGETDFFEQDRQHANRVSAFQKMGIDIEVDDFGSGRASIVGLRELQVNRIKLDHRLVTPIHESQSARDLVRSMIDIGRALNIPVTGEGVETEAHATILKELGCDRLQGFLYAPALPLADVLEIVEERHVRLKKTGTD